MAFILILNMPKNKSEKIAFAHGEGLYQIKEILRSGVARKLKCACADRNVDVLAERTRRHFIDFTLRGNGIFEGMYSTEKKAKVVLDSHIPRFVRCLQTEQHQGKLF